MKKFSIIILMATLSALSLPAYAEDAAAAKPSTPATVKAGDTAATPPTDEAKPADSGQTSVALATDAKPAADGEKKGTEGGGEPDCN